MAFERRMFAAVQDVELLLFAAETSIELQHQLETVGDLCATVSEAELTDLAAELARRVPANSSIRAAVVARHPQECCDRLSTLQTWLTDGIRDRLDAEAGLFLSNRPSAPTIGFLFPGQASPVYRDESVWQRRFPSVRDLYQRADLPTRGDTIDTAIVQPAIITASAAAEDILTHLGIQADLAVGHSLGELSALRWAGAYDTDAAIALARTRGRAMADLGSPTGGMASIGGDRSQVVDLIHETLTNPDTVRLAGLNSPRQTVISGESTAISAIVEQALAIGLKAVRLPVSHAFHSPLVAAAAQPLADYLAQQSLRPLNRRVISTITGGELPQDIDVQALLCQQVTDPVRFTEAIATASPTVDLWIEVGPGHVLSRLAQACDSPPAMSLDIGGPTLHGLCHAIGAAFALGAPLNTNSLFEDRFTRPFSLESQPTFFTNPCELAPKVPDSKLSHHEQQHDGDRQQTAAPLSPLPESTASDPVVSPAEPSDILEHLRRRLAERIELPVTAIQSHSRLLGDLHLNSISVGELVADTARSLGLCPPVSPTDYANATVEEVAQALTERAERGDAGKTPEPLEIAGVDAWVRPFRLDLIEKPLPQRSRQQQVPGTWEIVAAAEYPHTQSLQTAMSNCTGSGVVICLSPDFQREHLDLLLFGAEQVLKTQAGAQDQPKLVLLQHGWTSAAVARTLHLEYPEVTVCVIHCPIDAPDFIDDVVAEVEAARGFVEAHYDAAGTRYEPVLRLLQLPEAESPLPLSSTDVFACDWRRQRDCLRMCSGYGAGNGGETRLDGAIAARNRCRTLAKFAADASQWH